MNGIKIRLKKVLIAWSFFHSVFYLQASDEDLNRKFAELIQFIANSESIAADSIQISRQLFPDRSEVQVSGFVGATMTVYFRKVLGPGHKVLFSVGADSSHFFGTPLSPFLSLLLDRLQENNDVITIKDENKAWMFKREHVRGSPSKSYIVGSTLR